GLGLVAGPDAAMWVSETTAIVRVETSATHATTTTSSTTTTLPPGSDLSVSVADAPDPVHTHGNVIYTVTVANAGSLGANDVTLNFDLAGGRIVSATPAQSGASCTTGKGKQKGYTCSLGFLAGGGSQIVTVVAEAPVKPGAMSLTVGVSS